ncbi:MAG: D-Ala-D-Ala carboxypeptidase family metallohydrolase [Aquabacterium sp.]
MKDGIAWLLLCVSLAVSSQETRDAKSFASWRNQNSAVVADFEAHLRSTGLHSVVELHELLRSASSWRECGSEPYAVPPPEQWPSVESVLRLLRELTSQQVLGPFVVHSAYRGAELNKCAGGAAGSAHLRAFAVDLTPNGTEDLTTGICNFWREHGRGWNMGFGRYPSGRLHFDTAGYRTWGSDHTGKSAVCRAA